MADGKLDLNEPMLQRLDLVVGAVHYKSELDSQAQTERILRAMDKNISRSSRTRPGAYLGSGPEYAVGLDRVVEGAKERGVALELNAHPARLDLDDVHCKLAKEV